MDLSVVLLAGGKGSRMGGVSKALLTFEDGSTLLSRLMKELGPNVWISTTEAWSRDLRRAVCAPLILDEGQGPARALRVAADVVPSEWLALVGVDQLGVTRAMLEALRAAAREGDGAVVLQAKQPIPGLYRTAAVRALSGLEGRPLHEVVAALRGREVPGAGRVEADLNTPEDARAAGLKEGLR